MEDIRALERAIRRGAAGRPDAWRRLIRIMVWRLIAASLSGMRISTLRRCIEQWRRQFWEPDELDDGDWSEDALRALLADALKQRDVLIEVPGETSEGLTPERRIIELERQPRGPDGIHDDSVRKAVTFRSVAQRSAFIESWLESERALSVDKPESLTYGKEPSDSAHKLPTSSWAHVNFLLSEEWSRQNASQVMHLGVDSPGAARRVVQAIYHGLMTLRLRRHDFKVSASERGGLAAPIMPMDPETRYRYLYRFLYTHIVESGAWRLDRGFGRSDLSVDLLTLFAYPEDLGPHMLMQAGSSTPLKGLKLERIAEPLKQESSMWSNLLHGLGRSGHGLGGKRGEDAVEWVSHWLPGGDDEAEVYRMLPERDSPAGRRLHASAVALRIDRAVAAAQHGNDAHARAARDYCERELRQLRVSPGLLQELQDDIRRRYERILPVPGASVEEAELREAPKFLEMSRSDALKKLNDQIGWLPRVRSAASAILFRYCRSLAMKTEEVGFFGDHASDSDKPPVESDRPEQRQRTIDIASAWVIGWAADSLRSAAGAMSNDALQWPLVSARSMRDYIRLCHVLAQQINEANVTGRPELAEMADTLMAYAQGRAQVYVRHQFRFPRARISALLLEVSRLRAWSRIRLRRQSRLDALATSGEAAAARAKRKEAELRLHWEQLDAAWELLSEAESGLLRLGYPLDPVRQLYQERVETVIMMANVALAYRKLRTAVRDSEVSRHLQLAEDLLDVQQAFAYSPPCLVAVTEQQIQRLQQVRALWRG